MGYADCCPFLRAARRAPRVRGAGVRQAAGRRRSRLQGAATAQGAPAPRRPTWTTCSSELPPRLRRAHRATGASTRACWRCATTRARGCAQLVQRTGQWLREPDGDARADAHLEAALRWADWIEPLLRRESYLALLVERPGGARAAAAPAGRRQVAGALPDAAPGRDRRAGQRRACWPDRFVAADFERELEAAPPLAAASTGEDDDERLLNLLRHAHHAEVFRTLARDVEGRITVEQVADDLSALADTVLRVTARWCWRACAQPRTARRRSSRSSATASSAARSWATAATWTSCSSTTTTTSARREVYAAYVRKLINWLTVKTREGDLFEIDTALRPNGNSGLLTTSFEAYENYQLRPRQQHRLDLGTPGHDARALRAGRARRCGARFDARARGGDHRAARRRRAAGRDRRDAREGARGASGQGRAASTSSTARAAWSTPSSRCSSWCCRQSRAHPELIPNVGNIALLQRAEEAGLLPAGRRPARRRGLPRAAARAAPRAAQRRADAGAAERAGGRARGHAGAVEGGVWLSAAVGSRLLALARGRGARCLLAGCASGPRGGAAIGRDGADANPPAGPRPGARCRAARRSHPQQRRHQQALHRAGPRPTCRSPTTGRCARAAWPPGTAASSTASPPPAASPTTCTR